MKLIEISPFLRIILRYSLIQKPDISYSQDNRIFYIKKGTGHIFIDGKKYELKPNMLFLWQKGIPYKFEFVGERDVITINFDFTSDRSHLKESLPIFFASARNAEAISKIKSIIFEDCPELNKPIIINNARSIYPLLKELLEDISEPSTYSDAINSAKLKICIIEILKLLSLNSSNDVTNEKIDIVLDYIRNNYMQEINNKKLAKLVGYHPYHLNNMVKAATGRTLHQHIINYRILVAEKLLVTTNDSIYDIAANCGFSSTMVFIRNFKTKNELTPYKYREKIRNII